MIPFEVWIEKVAVALCRTNAGRTLYAAALRAASCSTLVELRGDEPQDVYALGDTPEEYASHLLEEWRLYGPEGE